MFFMIRTIFILCLMCLFCCSSFSSLFVYHGFGFFQLVKRGREKTEDDQRVRAAVIAKAAAAFWQRQKKERKQKKLIRFFSQDFFVSKLQTWSGEEEGERETEKGEEEKLDCIKVEGEKLL